MQQLSIATKNAAAYLLVKACSGSIAEFGVKGSIVTENCRAPGGLFVLYARSRRGPTTRTTVTHLARCPRPHRDVHRLCDRAGCRGHDAQSPPRALISGQKRSVFGIIKRELRRHSALKPIIGHFKV